VFRWLARIGLLGTVLLLLWTEPAWGTQPIAARTVVAALRAGEGFDRIHVHITGDLVLKPLGRITKPFICRTCIFDGDIRATDVVFMTTVDLSGSIVRGALLMTGATFEGPTSFGGPLAGGTSVTGPADFNLARFEDGVSFQGAHWNDAFFVGTTFRSDAIFKDTTFNDARFVTTAFAAEATFRGSSFPFATPV
jgi:hypothetical protein